MQITSWNIRGCNSALKIRILRRRIEKEKSGIIFLQETKCLGEELTSLSQKNWKGCESVVIDARGEVRGMGILWNPWEVNLLGFLATPFSLSAGFHILGTGIKGFFTNVYGPPRAEQKTTFLDLLSDTKEIAEGKSWILGGDFNMIRNLEEKKGGIRNLHPANAKFNDLIDDLNLIDVRTSNGIFMWNNKQDGDRGIACWLDRIYHDGRWKIKSDGTSSGRIGPLAYQSIMG